MSSFFSQPVVSGKNYDSKEIVFTKRAESGFSQYDSNRTSEHLMSDWDDENVIVIDLTEERSLTSATSTGSEARSSDKDAESYLTSKEVTLLEDLDVSYNEQQLIRSEGAESLFDSHRKTSNNGILDKNFRADSSVTPSPDDSNDALDSDFHWTDLKQKKDESVALRLRKDVIHVSKKSKSRQGSSVTRERVNLKPIQLRPWEKKTFRGEFLGRREITYIKPINGGHEHEELCDTDSVSSLTQASADSVHRIRTPVRPVSRSLSSGRPGKGSAPLSLISQKSAGSFHEPLLNLRNSGGQKIDTKQLQTVGDKSSFITSSLRTRSSDFLDRIETSSSYRARSRSSVAVSSSSRGLSGHDRDCMTRIEKSLYLGNIEAATDVILLESHGITHIITVDSVPLPRKISSMLPRTTFMHIQVSDLPDEDLLTQLYEAIVFIEAAVLQAGSVLVHCYRGKSRSATVVIAYLMFKHRYKLEKAFLKVKSRREIINPHLGFLAQLKLFEVMNYAVDPNNIQYKMFRLFCASERMRKAKVLFKDSLEKVLDIDPAGGLPGSAEAEAAVASKSHYPMIYKCKKCRRTLATAFNIMPHVRGESPNWMDDKWSRLSEENVLEDAANPAGLDICTQSVFITPVGWMENEICKNLSGKLYCPNCQARVGYYSWVMGDGCHGCKAIVVPSFQLDMTEIIFRTHNRYLQSGYASRGPILV